MTKWPFGKIRPNTPPREAPPKVAPLPVARQALADYGAGNQKAGVPPVPAEQQALLVNVLYEEAEFLGQRYAEAVGLTTDAVAAAA